MTRPCFILSDHQQILLSKAPAAPPPNLLFEIAFATPDLGRMRTYLLAHNVAVGRPARDINSVEYFSLRDPEGNPIAFVQLHPLTGSNAPAGKLSSSPSWSSCSRSSVSSAAWTERTAPSRAITVERGPEMIAAVAGLCRRARSRTATNATSSATSA